MSTAAIVKKTIYVRRSDEAIWDRAADMAKVRRLSLSSFVAEALESYLASQGAKA